MTMAVSVNPIRFYFSTNMSSSVVRFDLGGRVLTSPDAVSGQRFQVNGLAAESTLAEAKKIGRNELVRYFILKIENTLMIFPYSP